MIIKYDKTDTLKEKNDFGKDKIEEIKMLVIQSYECEEACLAYSDIAINSTKQPAHYVIDAESIYKYAPSSTNLYESDVKFTSLANKLLPTKQSTSILEQYAVKSVKGLKEVIQNTFNNNTRVINALDTDFRGNYINIVEVCWGTDSSKYDLIANNLVKFLIYMIRNHGYTIDNIWRAGDIIDYGDSEKELIQRNPYQYSHLKDWKSLLDAVEYGVNHPEDTNIKSHSYCFEKDDHLNIEGHCISPNSDPEHNHTNHIHHWEADDREINALKAINIKQSSIINEDFSCKTINGSNFMQSNFETNMTQEFVEMESNYYEPIYPDLTVPPRSCTGLYDKGVYSIKQILDTLTESEKKALKESAEIEAQIENNNDNTEDVIKDISEKKLKPILGKIVNIFDEYPVDDKIVQLENHAPIVTLEYEEANNINNNLPFYMINRSINTEKRLVTLENILATQTRILNRLSSRITINCVYYGGQSVFDKQAM